MTVPEIEGRQFDLICLFSVFTHLAPADYVAMLRLLRRFAKPGGRLFLHDASSTSRTPGGHGYVDDVSPTRSRDSNDHAWGAELSATTAAGEPSGSPTSTNAVPAKPLLYALSPPHHFPDLVDGTGSGAARPRARPTSTCDVTCLRAPVWRA